MRFGVVMFPTDESIGPGQLAAAVEEAGFESLFFPEHTHIPASRETPWPGGAELPRAYTRTYDPFVALAVAASATRRLKLGTGICLVVQRDPIITAKEVSTLDRLSDGRFLFGVGAGWNREEMANHGTDPRTRMRLFLDRIRAMKALWTQEEATYAGEFVSFERVWQWPKPMQRPHPPILVGNSGPGALERVLAVGDEWLPINRGPEERLAARIAELQRLAQQRGRERVPVTLFSATAEHRAVERYAAMGVDRCLFMLPSVPRDEALERLGRYAEVVAAFI